MCVVLHVNSFKVTVNVIVLMVDKCKLVYLVNCQTAESFSMSHSCPYLETSWDAVVSNSSVSLGLFWGKHSSEALNLTSRFLIKNSTYQNSCL